MREPKYKKTGINERIRTEVAVELQDVLGSLPAELFTPQEVEEIIRHIRAPWPHPGLYLGAKIREKVEPMLQTIKEMKRRIDELSRIIRL